MFQLLLLLLMSKQHVIVIRAELSAAATPATNTMASARANASLLEEDATNAWLVLFYFLVASYCTDLSDRNVFER